MTKPKRKKPIIPPMKLMEDLMPREPKKRDPLAALKKKHPRPWKAEPHVDGTKIWWCVLDANGYYVELYISHSTIARAIAKLGAK